jgi:hypothetical protein
VAAHHRPARYYSGRLWLDSDWRSRFPQGHFTIRVSLTGERRESYLVPLESGNTEVVASTTFSSNLEIRIKSATISWQFRNFMGADYETVPGFRMPSRINLYGVRWTFTN